jgi:hypothetical protein
MSISFSLCCAFVSTLRLSSLPPILAWIPVSEPVLLAQAIPSPKDSADRLDQEGLRTFHFSQYPVALEKFQSALDTYRQISDHFAEGTTLSNP